MRLTDQDDDWLLASDSTEVQGNDTVITWTSKSCALDAVVDLMTSDRLAVFGKCPQRPCKDAIEIRYSGIDFWVVCREHKLCWYVGENVIERENVIRRTDSYQAETRWLVTVCTDITEAIANEYNMNGGLSYD